ncbi:hypothetical protein OGATHE_005025 [Ogataea polymorpha]|uniref:RGS domain-containing protein n=1 Tax=Ogataea polymorpha TaxID=460523 RepID=A0A9P8SZG1_9ASCO|nr:hypothetical protein OGATHE_005025 [Ogataea polymorpha]
MALSNANPQRLSGPNTTSNFVRADDLEQKVVSKLEVDTLQSEKQSVNRWPTLFEILNRRTQPPVDLWSFYVYMRDEQRNIDYLDFWIDTVQHMGLCKAYVKGLKQSLAVNERIRNADQTFNSAPGQSTHLGQQTSPSNRQSNTSSRDSKSSSLLLDLLMRSNLLEESDSRRMSAFLRGETSVRSSDPLVNAKIDELKRKSQTPSDDNSKDASSESNSAKRVSTINPQMIETMIQQDLLPREKSLKDSHIATREKLSQSAQNIVDTYFLDSSPKRIVIPPEMVERLIQAVQRDGRDDPEVFDESREFVFKAMEHEAYPNFLRYHALSNGSLGADSSSRIICQELFQKINTMRVQIRNDVGQVLFRPFREAGLEVAQVDDVWPDLLSWRSQNTENLKNLIDFRITCEKRLPVGHLGKDTTNRPHVDSCRVLFSSKKDLRASVPQCNNLVSVCTQWHPESSGKAKVGNLQITFFVDEQILGFQVPMQDSMRVAVVEPTNELKHKLLDHVASQSFTFRNRFHVFLEVHIKELENKINLVGVGVHNVIQSNNVVITKLLQKRDFTNGGRWHSLVLRLQPDLLQCHYAVVVFGI